MPATIGPIYSIPDDAQDFEAFSFSKNTILTYFTRNVYSDPECKKLIGVAFYETYIHSFAGNRCAYGNIFIKFNENSGYPYGDDNILVLTATAMNKLIPGTLRLIDGTYVGEVNAELSTGEYAGQVGNFENIRNNKAGLNDVTTIKFPLPIVTYTDAFNSLPQKPSTAPRPA